MHPIPKVTRIMNKFPCISCFFRKNNIVQLFENSIYSSKQKKIQKIKWIVAWKKEIPRKNMWVFKQNTNWGAFIFNFPNGKNWLCLQKKFLWSFFLGNRNKNSFFSVFLCIKLNVYTFGMYLLRVVLAESL